MAFRKAFMKDKTYRSCECHMRKQSDPSSRQVRQRAGIPGQSLQYHTTWWLLLGVRYFWEYTHLVFFWWDGRCSAVRVACAGSGPQSSLGSTAGGGCGCGVMERGRPSLFLDEYWPMSCSARCKRNAFWVWWFAGRVVGL